MPRSFHLPSRDELYQLGAVERLNVFRRFFASSRYGRLIIQKHLVRSALEKAHAQDVVAMEKTHNENFELMVRTVTEYGFIDEFLTAVKEEDSALQKIIEAYDKRMEGRI